MTTDLLWRQLLEAAVEIQHIIDNNECMQLLTKYPDLLIGASRWIQAQATEMNKCLDMQEVLRGEVDDLSKRIVNYSHKAYEANFQLERCYCEDKGYDPDYGWPVGDHVPVTMADSILARLVNMRAALEMLQRWDLLEPLVALPAEWTDLRLHQAPDGTISITELIPHDFVGGTFSNTHPPRVSWVDVPVPPTLPPHIMQHASDLAEVRPNNGCSLGVSSE